MFAYDSREEPVDLLDVGVLDLPAHDPNGPGAERRQEHLLARALIARAGALAVLGLIPE